MSTQAVMHRLPGYCPVLSLACKRDLCLLTGSVPNSVLNVSAFGVCYMCIHASTSYNLMSGRKHVLCSDSQAVVLRSAFELS